MRLYKKAEEKEQKHLPEGSTLTTFVQIMVN